MGATPSTVKALMAAEVKATVELSGAVSTILAVMEVLLEAPTTVKTT